MPFRQPYVRIPPIANPPIFSLASPETLNRKNPLMGLILLMIINNNYHMSTNNDQLCAQDCSGMACRILQATAVTG